MLEVCFSQSAAGSLKYAQRCGRGMTVTVPILEGENADTAHVFKAQKSHETSLVGSTNDIYCFALGLDMGKIADDVFSKERRCVLAEILGEEVDFSKEEKEFAALIQRLQSGEEIRIWYSDEPNELCGMYWFVSEIAKQKHTGEVFLLKLPQYRQINEKEIVRYKAWGEVSPEELVSFLPLQKPLTKAFCNMISVDWVSLRRENAELRAKVNNKLESLPEYFYDYWILKALKDQPEEFSEPQLIGQVLGRYQLPISDMWVAFRIEKMVADGLLETVTKAKDGECSYRRILKKTEIK